MILAIHTNSSYLFEPNAKSDAAMHFYCTYKNTPDLTMEQYLPSPPSSNMSWPWPVKQNLLLFSMVANLVSLYTALEEMGQCQPPTLITKDNSTIAGLTSDAMQPKAPKSIDMLVLAQTPTSTATFQLQLKCGANNSTEYHSKHHMGTYHQLIMHHYVLDPIPTNQLGAQSNSNTLLNCHWPVRVCWSPTPMNNGQIIFSTCRPFKVNHVNDVAHNWQKNHQLPTAYHHKIMTNNS